MTQNYSLSQRAGKYARSALTGLALLATSLTGYGCQNAQVQATTSETTTTITEDRSTLPISPEISRTTINYSQYDLGSTIEIGEKEYFTRELEIPEDKKAVSLEEYDNSVTQYKPIRLIPKDKLEVRIIQNSNNESEREEKAKEQYVLVNIYRKNGEDQFKINNENELKESTIGYTSPINDSTPSGQIPSGVWTLTQEKILDDTFLTTPLDNDVLSDIKNILPKAYMELPVTKITNLENNEVRREIEGVLFAPIKFKDFVKEKTPSEAD